MGDRTLSRLAVYYLLAAVFLICWSISRESLWIDEGDTAVYALQPKFGDFWNHLKTDPNADCQMPLTMFVAWIVDKIVGSSEWILRFPNLIWSWLSLLVLFFAGKKQGIPWMPFLFAVQPYLWFYMDEARPYVFQIMCGCFLLYAVVLFRSGERNWTWPFVVGSVLLAYATLLAPVTLAAVLAAALYPLKKGIRKPWPGRNESLLILTAALLCVPVGVYYLQTILRGAGGAQLWEISLVNVGYLFYELMGFSGIGASPSIIREYAVTGSFPRLLADYPWNWFLVGSFAFLLGLFLLRGLINIRTQTIRLELTACLMILALVVVFFFILGIFLQKAFWARHLAPVFPFVCYALALLAQAVRSAHVLKIKGLFLDPLGILILFVWLCSSLNIRFGDDFRKEDYRTVAQKARQVLSNGGTVAWSASWHCAYYYGLPVDREGQSEAGDFVVLFGSGRRNLEGIKEPSLVVIGKQDVYDRDGSIQRWVQAKGYGLSDRIPNFEIYSK